MIIICNCVKFSTLTWQSTGIDSLLDSSGKCRNCRFCYVCMNIFKLWRLLLTIKCTVDPCSVYVLITVLKNVISLWSSFYHCHLFLCIWICSIMHTVKLFFSFWVLLFLSHFWIKKHVFLVWFKEKAKASMSKHFGNSRKEKHPSNKKQNQAEGGADICPDGVREGRQN